MDQGSRTSASEYEFSHSTGRMILDGVLHFMSELCKENKMSNKYAEANLGSICKTLDESKGKQQQHLHTFKLIFNFSPFIPASAFFQRNRVKPVSDSMCIEFHPECFW